MANYNKSFNFRNGVQVDNDNFIVNSAGLVGIGTSIPYSYLDVHGASTLRDNVTVTGVTSTTNLFTTGISTVNNNFHVGSAITSYASSGIISATKYYGDGSNLSGVYAVSTLGWFIDPTFAGGVGIAYTQFRVGLGTTNAPNQLTVNGGVDDDIALFLSNDKNSFIKFKDSEQTSSVQIGARSNDFVVRLGSSELYTMLQTGEVGIGSTNPTNTLEVAGVTSTSHLTVSGVSTFRGLVGFDSPISTGVGATVGFGTTAYFDNKVILNDNLEISHENDVSLIRDTRAGIGSTLAIGADKLFLRNRDGNENYLEATDNGSVKIYYDFLPKLETSGVGVTITSQLDVTNVNVSSGTTTGTLRVTGITSTNDTIHVLKTSGAAIVAVGESALGGYNGYLKYGETGGGFKYSNSETLDLVTTSPGSFNFIYDADLQLGAGSTAGDVGFQWIRGSNMNPLMTLTGIGGSLGIGITAPIHPLHVSGIATFTSKVFVGGQLDVLSTLTPRENLTLPTGNIEATLGTLTVGGASSIVSANISNATVGTLTLTSLAAGTALTGVARLGIGTDPAQISDQGSLFASNNGSNTPASRLLSSVIIGEQGQVGIGTTHVKGVTSGATGSRLGVYGSAYIVDGALGVGIHGDPVHAVNFKDAGSVTRRFMTPPTVTTAQRGNLTNKVAGALVYNSTTNKLNFWNGSAWEVVTSS